MPLLEACFHLPAHWPPPLINVSMSMGNVGRVWSDMSRKFNCIHSKQHLIQMSILELQIEAASLEVQVQCLSVVFG